MGARVSHHHMLVPRVGVSGHKTLTYANRNTVDCPDAITQSPRYHYVIMELGPRRPSVFFGFGDLSPKRPKSMMVV